MIFQATQLLVGVFCYHPEARHCDVDLFVFVPTLVHYVTTLFVLYLVNMTTAPAHLDF